MTELIVFFVHVIRAILEDRDKRAKAAPLRPPVAPLARNRPTAAQQFSSTSQDPPYERSAWRTVLTVLTVILMAALVLTWIIYMQK